jgi:hypothetical protein
MFHPPKVREIAGAQAHAGRRLVKRPRSTARHIAADLHTAAQIQD